MNDAITNTINIIEILCVCVTNSYVLPRESIARAKIQGKKFHIRKKKKRIIILIIFFDLILYSPTHVYVYIFV